MTRSSKTANQLFWSMIQSAHRQGKGLPHMLERTIIGVDPGETTGLCFRSPAREGFQITMEQLNTQDRNRGGNALRAWIQEIPLWNPLMVCEDYRVYGHKSDQHKWAGLHTPKLIGHIERIAYELEIPVVYPMAIEGKSWADDDNLKRWELYDPGMKHARDASRHVITRAFFGKDPL